MQSKGEEHSMSRKLPFRKGEKGIINAVERCINLMEEWTGDRKLYRRLRFEQSVRVLVKTIPEEWQDPQFITDTYKACMDLLTRKGILAGKE